MYYWDTYRGNLTITNPEPILSRNWALVQTCFFDNKLTLMNISGATEFWLTLQQIIEKYGPPDRVTWASQYYDRSFIWAEKGLLMVVGMYLEDEPYASNVILFSPVPRCQLEESWLYQSLPKEGQPFSGDVAIVISSAEDAWGVEKGLSDCP